MVWAEFLIKGDTAEVESLERLRGLDIGAGLIRLGKEFLSGSSELCNLSAVGNKTQQKRQTAMKGPVKIENFFFEEVDSLKSWQPENLTCFARLFCWLE